MESTLVCCTNRATISIGENSNPELEKSINDCQPLDISWFPVDTKIKLININKQRLMENIFRFSSLLNKNVNDLMEKKIFMYWNNKIKVANHLIKQLIFQVNSCFIDIALENSRKIYEEITSRNELSTK